MPGSLLIVSHDQLSLFVLSLSGPQVKSALLRTCSTSPSKLPIHVKWLNAKLPACPVLGNIHHHVDGMTDLSTCSHAAYN